MSLKLENIIVFTIYLLAILRHDALSTRRAWSVCGLHGAENIILSAGGAETIILSVGGAESMMLSA